MGKANLLFWVCSHCQSDVSQCIKTIVYNIKHIVYKIIRQKDQLLSQGCIKLTCIIISKYNHGSC